MKNAIILHGMPSKEEYEQPGGNRQSLMHWMPWLKSELEKVGYVVNSPDLPEPYDPDYDAWSKVFEKLEIGPETILIGHSCGAGFLVRWLSEHPVVVARVALVAPFLDPENHAPRMAFNQNEIDLTLSDRNQKIKIFISKDDDDAMLWSVNKIRSALPKVEYQEFTNQGHFTLGDMGTEKFPELLNWLVETYD